MSGANMGLTLYGIRNCDTMKKARAWLDAARVIVLLCGQPSMIGRPVLDVGARCLVGFTPAAWAEAVRDA